MLHLAKPRVHSAQTQRALHAVDGYLYLGMNREALAELETIDPMEQDASEVLLARIRVLFHLQRWKTAEALAERCVDEFPGVADFTVQRIFALHQMNQGDDATNIILAAPEWLRRSGLIHYNLACYEARLGNLTMAKRCIAYAIQLNAGIRKTARRDPDLQEIYK